MTEQNLEDRVRKLEHDVSWLRQAVIEIVKVIKSAAGQMRAIDLPEEDGDNE